MIPWTVFLATAVAATWRLYYLNFVGLWFDEAYFVVFARPWSSGGVNSLADLIKWLAKGDVHPPLYFAFLFYWIRLLGDSEVSLRLLSALFGTATVPFSYLLGKRSMGVWPGVVLAWLVALSPGHILASTEARMYPLLVLFTTIAAFSAIEIVNHQKSSVLFGISYCASMCAAIAVHYMGWIVFAGHLMMPIFLLLSHSRDDREKTTQKTALALFHWQAITMILCTPFLYLGWIQSSKPLWHLRATTWKSAAEAFSQISPQGLVSPNSLNVLSGFLILIIALYGVFKSVKNALQDEKNHSKLSVFLLLMMGFIAPAILLCIAGIIRPVFSPKSIQILLVPFLAAVCYGLFKIHNKFLRAVSAFIIILFTCFSLFHLSDKLNDRPDYRAAAKYLASENRKNTHVVLADNWQNITYLYYDGSDRVLLEKDSQRLSKIFRGNLPFYFVAINTPNIPVTESLANLIRFDYQASQAASFNQLEIYYLHRNPSEGD